MRSTKKIQNSSSNSLSTNYNSKIAISLDKNVLNVLKTICKPTINHTTNLDNLDNEETLLTNKLLNSNKKSEKTEKIDIEKICSGKKFKKSSRIIDDDESDDNSQKESI